MRRGKKAHRACYTMQGTRKVRCRASIDPKTGRCELSDFLKRVKAGFLHGMQRVDVFRTSLKMFGQRQKARMFARTVVVNLTRAGIRFDQIGLRRHIVRHLRPATHVIITKSQII